MIVSVHRVACESAAVVSISYCMKYNGRKDGCCSSKALRSYYISSSSGFNPAVLLREVYLESRFVNLICSVQATLGSVKPPALLYPRETSSCDARFESWRITSKSMQSSGTYLQKDL